MNDEIDDLCPKRGPLPEQPTEPHAQPIYLSSVYECHDPTEADGILGGKQSGYVYARDGHPNADMLAERCRQLHGAERAAITSSGMSALALLLLSQLAPGDHLVVSNQLYGRSLTLLVPEAARLGMTSTVVDTCDTAAVAAAMYDRTRLIVVETISNPLLRVADLRELAAIAHARGAMLAVDNTFAGPAVCRPIEFGADWVLESLTKSMNGHSDVVLGLLCGSEARWARVPTVLSTFGITSAPFDCWLAFRGLTTLGVRAERACANAHQVALFLAAQNVAVEVTHYPGLPTHPDHALAVQQFKDRFGTMVTFTLRGGRADAERFIAAAQGVPFCPSLGEADTTLSHPESTSHRSLTPEARLALGITGGTIRLSVGIESPAGVIRSLAEGLEGLAE